MSGRETWPLITKAAIAVYIAMLLFSVLLGYYVLTYAIFLISFLFLVLNFPKLRFFKSIEAKPLIQKVLFILFIALTLRFILLAQEQIITRDIEVYVLRAEWMMIGKIPYDDFSVNKPPLYAYLLYFIGRCIGAGEIQFRAFFSIMDSIVAVLLFYLCTCKYDVDFSFKASFAYALCPLPIVSIGLAGHYEPVVMIFILLSLIYLFKNKYNKSGLLLGIAFAFKFFPFVLLPFFAWKIDSWKNRVFYLLLFSIPIIISVIPILILSPTGFWNYLSEQSYSWTAKKSFAFAFELITGTQYILGLRISLLITTLFLSMILAMFISWQRKRFNMTFWFKIAVVSYAVYYGAFITASIKFYHSELGIDPIPAMLIFAILYFSIISFIAYRYGQHFKLKVERREEVFILSAFSLIFLLFGSSQYNPWYILWLLPFVLAIKNDRLRTVLLWLIFWNFEGIGISLLPGLSLA